MALNFLSKYGIIIGAVAMCLSLMFFASHIPKINMIIHPEYYNIILSTSLILEIVGLLILTLLSGVLSGLLILGIVKKRHLLLAPWLITAFLLSVFVSSYAIYEAVIRRNSYSLLDSCKPFVLIIGMGIIVLYPIWNLFTKIRSDNAAVVKPKVVPERSML